MSDPLFREDAYFREAPARVTAHGERGVVLDRSLFYPNGGGQPGDKGHLTWSGGRMEVVNTLKGDGEDIALVPAEGDALPPIGTVVTRVLDWEQRMLHMRMHTALHLLSVVIPLPVTGGQIGGPEIAAGFRDG